MKWTDIRPSAYLRKKKLDEVGLYALRRFRRGATIGVFYGDRISLAEADHRKITKWQIHIENTNDVLDLIDSDCKLKFVNSADSLSYQNCMLENRNDKIILVALTDICSGEELLAWYDF